MMITEHFAWHEFASRQPDGTVIEVPEQYRADVQRLCETVLEPLRARVGQPLVITGRGGWRTRVVEVWLYRGSKHGVPKRSQHEIGKAADLVPPYGMTAEDLAGAIDAGRADGTIAPGGLGLYAWGVHVDIGRPRRWDWR